MRTALLLVSLIAASFANAQAQTEKLGMVGNSETFYQIVTPATPAPAAPAPALTARAQ